MSNEEIQKLKLSCLELATKTADQDALYALETAKYYYEWVNKEHLDLISEDFTEHKSKDRVFSLNVVLQEDGFASYLSQKKNQGK